MLVYMEEKLFHYDGSVHNENIANSDGLVNETFQITDEMRKTISGNPYMIDHSE